MNIDKLNDRLAPQATHNTVGIHAIRQRPVVESDAVTAGDQVDMSMISRLMARSLRVLADSDQVRPEVLAKHQQLPQLNVRFDNQTVDRIYGRMQNR